MKNGKEPSLNDKVDGSVASVRTISYQAVILWLQRKQLNEHFWI